MNEQAQTAPVAEVTDPIEPLKKLAEQDRKKGMDALNELFRSGKPPEVPLNGPYDGELVVTDIAPVLNQAVGLVTGFWMPWKGKYFVADEHRGDNLFGKESRLALRLIYPFYRRFEDYSAEMFRGFRFNTSIAEGMEDKDIQVFRIDYDRSDNPPITIRNIVDEITEVADGVYLGKIHFEQFWGGWTMIGYFALRRPT